MARHEDVYPNLPERSSEPGGILMERAGDRWQGRMAPTFDHASSLGRELLDVSEAKCRKRLLAEGRVGDYSEKAHGAIFWDQADKRGLSPLNPVPAPSKRRLLIELRGHWPDYDPMTRGEFEPLVG